MNLQNNQNAVIFYLYVWKNTVAQWLPLPEAVFLFMDRSNNCNASMPSSWQHFQRNVQNLHHVIGERVYIA